jgi:anti-anti-sigma factor
VQDGLRPLETPRPALEIQALEIHTCVEPGSGTAVVRVGGEIDVATASLFHQAIVRQLERHYHAVADLTEVTFMDASGVGALMRAEQTARRCGVRLTVASPSRVVARVLRLTQADRSLHIVAGVDGGVTVADGGR